MPAPATPALTPLSGWAGYPLVETRVIPLHRVETLRTDQGPRAIRGNGRAYGDAAVLAAGPTYSSLPQNRFLEFDRALGLLHAESGVTIAEILDVTVPGGWILPVVPGTRHATLGGCIAADVHGKNHPTSGSFAHHLAGLTLVTADGNQIAVSPESTAHLFWATCGGMGLTGYVREATLRLEPVETDSMISVLKPCANLDASLASLIGENADYPHAAVWIDGFAKGSQLGRGIVSQARYARTREVSARLLHKPLGGHRSPFLNVPKALRRSLLPRVALQVFNRLYQSAHNHRKAPITVSLASSFFPLDAVAHWNRLYGKRGFLQYQIVLPESTASPGFRELLERLQAISSPPYLAVLKRFGALSAGPLSFPLPGFTLALDLPRTAPELPKVLDEFDARVASFGGRVYLAKDSRVKPEVFAAMYPRLAEWRKTKMEVDPESLFQTELGRRLRLCA